MRLVGSFVIAAAAAFGQFAVSVDESQIRAFLRNDTTAVSIPVRNTAGAAVKARLALWWLSVDDQGTKVAERAVTIVPGDSRIETPAPLTKGSIWTRLRYRLEGDLSDARLFAPLDGMVSLAQIADYIFELRASYAGTIARGRPFTVYAEAVHPISRQPIAAANWEAALSVDGRKPAAREAKQRPEGFVEWTFDVPAAADDGNEEAEVEVRAKRGDFAQRVILEARLPVGLSGRVQSDKPLYQPGQTLHLRALITDAQDQAAAGAKVEVRINGPDGERARSLELEASKFGVVHDDWTIPATAELGTYEIQLRSVGESEREIARHIVRVSRYELPAFLVTAKPDRGAYLPGQAARVTVTGAYLFGKPVAKGRVRVVRMSGGRSEVVGEGEAGPDGAFTAEIDLAADHQGFANSAFGRFEDIHFAAYFTDPLSTRTEQRRFDVRITREPIHLSVVRRAGGGSLPSPVYVATSHADGRPAAATVEVRWKGEMLRVQTNRYGVGKLLFPSGETEGDVVFQARDATGLAGSWTETSWREGQSLLRMEPARTLYRAGEAVTLRLVADPSARGDGAVLIHAIAEGRRVATQVARLANHRCAVTFPYQPEFRRAVGFVAWTGGAGSRERWEGHAGTATVIYPDGTDLGLTVSPAQRVYRPGETASVRMQVTTREGKPVEAALGLAVVDQAVLERARTEDEFGRRRWFNCAFCRDEGEEELGGIRLNDLYGLRATVKITPELDLLAEALAARSGVTVADQSSETFGARPAFASVGAQARRMKETLDRHYGKTLEFPEDLAALARILDRQWVEAVDPWGRRYRAEFRVEQEYRTVVLRSGGPDKSFGTADDFAAAAFRAPYFAPAGHLIERVLRDHGDYPATAEEFANLLSENGLLLKTLRDPWGTAYQADAITTGVTRRIRVMSAGPDRRHRTGDDVVVGDFSGPYFRRERELIARAIREARKPPRTVDDFLGVLRRAGIDVDGYRDAWGRPYRVISEPSSRYSDRIRLTTTRVFGNPPSVRSEVTPLTQRFVVFSLRSAGSDGVENNSDDFAIARVPVLLREETASPATEGRPQAPAARSGAGTIWGIVTDGFGGVIPNAGITLWDITQTSQETATDQTGLFQFASLAPGMYSLKVNVAGFRGYEMSEIPVASDQVTNIDIELQVGTVEESVTVEAPAAELQTQAAAQRAAGTAATPRLRDYFPETLVWVPEIVTGVNGAASHRFALADSVTSWKIAVFASTTDGRTAEAEGELRAFLPFFVEFHPPPVLTAGDRIELPVTIRNYQDRAQEVTAVLAPNDWSAVAGEASKQVAVPANGMARLTYGLQARKIAEKAAQRVIATAGRSRDAVERTLQVRPDGQESVRTVGSVLAGVTTFPVAIPAEAIAGATRGEVRIYAGIAPLLLESASEVLSAPLDCAEQVISAGYANLIAWRFARAAGIGNAMAEQRALPHVKAAVARIGELRRGDGGLSYWRGGEPDAAVTAHALSFLAAASEVTEVDRAEMEQLVSWLEGAQTKAGLWQPPGARADAGGRQSLLLTGMVARALAEAQRAGAAVSQSVLAGAYGQLARFTDATSEPYLLASFILAAMASGHESVVADTPARLAAMGRDEEGARYWDVRTNTPFHGWGRAGRHETTGLVVSALLAWRAKHPATPGLDERIRSGLYFLVRGRGRDGGWSSTQATLRAMSALADAAPVLGQEAGAGGSVEVRVNGRVARKVTIPGDRKAADALTIDVSGLLAAGANEIVLMPAGAVGFAAARLMTSHSIPWEQARARVSEELRYAVRFHRLDVDAGMPVRCTVSAERVGFRGYGMMLAEVGLPPGVEPDRSSLEAVLGDRAAGVDRYEILPDRVLFYLWPRAGGSSFDFFVTPRCAMTAKSTRSVLYDYYNAEALSEVAPSTWSIR
ncbi:MAG: carboxypeptidase regulatory-like domain-containing protein [Bryobacterales bacterium]|nr:carboxypeptidase regulatory-like domain-containing protein [Bryobacterales bacterium]